MYTFTGSIMFFILGCVFGIILSFVYYWFFNKQTTDKNSDVLNEVLSQHKTLLEQRFVELKSSLKDYSYESLTKSTELLSQMSKTQITYNRDSVTKEINNNREQVTENIDKISKELQKLNNLMFDPR